MITPSGRSLAIALAVVLSLSASAVAAAPPHASSRPSRIVAPPRPSSPPLKIALLLSANGRGERSVNDAALAGLDAAWKRDRLLVAMRGALRPEAYATTLDELAAVESKRGKVGFVGGRDTPNVQAFECGWETGVRWATKERFLDVRGRAVYIGTTEEAFADPDAGEELSRAMIAQQGVDVLYAAAGSSGLGVIEAARQARVKVIGVDTDQRHVAPAACRAASRPA